MKTASQQTLKGEVSLSRWTGGAQQGWRLTIEDSASRLRVVEIQLTDEQFGQLVGGRVTDLAVEHWTSPNIGKTMEVKVINVPGLTHESWQGPDRHRTTPVYGAMGAQGYGAEDGWVPQIDETFNRHRSSAEGYAVTLRRWVTPPVKIPGDS